MGEIQISQCEISLAITITLPSLLPGRVAQSEGHLTHKSEVLGSILSFLLPLIQEGQLSVTGESMCTKSWLTP